MSAVCGPVSVVPVCVCVAARVWLPGGACPQCCLRRPLKAAAVCGGCCDSSGSSWCRPGGLGGGGGGRWALGTRPSVAPPPPQHCQQSRRSVATNRAARKVSGFDVGVALRTDSSTRPSSETELFSWGCYGEFIPSCYGEEVHGISGTKLGC